jgi:hypothetical protein
MAAAVLLLGGATAACGGGGGRASKTVATTTPVTRLPPGVVPGQTTTTLAPAALEQRSQPWWKSLTSFHGDGPTTTAVFAVDPGALQWRVTWHCDGAGPFSIQPLKDTGEPLKRTVGDAATCPQDGKGFSSQAGRFTLKVTAGGPWTADVEEQVDSPLIEPMTAEMSSPAAKVIESGAIYNIDKVGKGRVSIYQLADGSRMMRLEDFYVSINSDLELRLSKLPAPKTTEESANAPFETVAPLKATVGAMNYPVPADADLSQYHSVVIWCELTHNAYAGAALAP